MDVVSNDQDADLIDACRSKKPGAWESLCARYTDQLYNFARLITRDGATAEDCVQEAFLEVHNKIAQFTGSGTFKSWLFKITKNKAIQCMRKRRPETNGRLLDRCPASMDSDDPVQALTDSEYWGQVDRGLLHLPGTWRLAWVLREKENLEFTEIGNILKVSESRARGLVHQARQRLASYLEKHGLGPT
jgi:RNA polymerase sigma-70 factor, ECF subfamily